MRSQTLCMSRSVYAKALRCPVHEQHPKAQVGQHFQQHDVRHTFAYVFGA